MYISAKEMALEQIVKDLQAQNAQFQQMFMALAQGQEELKALVIKEKKKKKAKKLVGILKMGTRLRRPVKGALDLSTPSNKGIIMKKITTRELMKMKLIILRSSILLLMINTNSRRIVSMLWIFSRCLAWTLKN